MIAGGGITTANEQPVRASGRWNAEDSSLRRVDPAEVAYGSYSLAFPHSPLALASST